MTQGIKIIVCGGRDFTARDYLFAALDLVSARTPIITVIEGGQRRWVERKLVGGADYWAGQWALARHVECITVPADWDDLSHPDACIKIGMFGRRYDAMAGIRRNTKMLGLEPDALIAFKGGDGTADMMSQAHAAGVSVIDVERGGLK